MADTTTKPCAETGCVAVAARGRSHCAVHEHIGRCYECGGVGECEPCGGSGMSGCGFCDCTGCQGSGKCSMCKGAGEIEVTRTPLRRKAG
jgi:hypothetical protein